MSVPLSRVETSTDPETQATPKMGGVLRFRELKTQVPAAPCEHSEFNTEDCKP